MDCTWWLENREIKKETTHKKSGKCVKIQRYTLRGTPGLYPNATWEFSTKPSGFLTS
jgi:hypothetical protein